MAGGGVRAAVGQLRRLIGRHDGGALADAQLLEDFVARGDQKAFEVLVWRHAAMVLGLCQRVLRDPHDAEDAFQATFLVFARKAGSIGKTDAVGSWLYKVAYRVALRARCGPATRPTPETLAVDPPARDDGDDLVWRDLRPVLDEEIGRLPEKYRVPFVLCYLEGLTNEEAAAQVGCPKGTILSRLARGRERLQSRLTRRGLALSAGWVAAVTTQSEAAVPAALVDSTARTATQVAAGKAVAGLVPAPVAALSEGVIRAMFLTKLKVVTAALVALTVLGTGAGLLAQRVPAERAPDGGRGVAPAREPAGQPRRDAGRSPAAGPAFPGDGRAFPLESTVQFRGERGAAADRRGIVKAVDPAAKTITLTTPAGRDTAPTETTYKLAADAEIALDNGRRGVFQPGAIKDVTPGCPVALTLSADQKAVDSVLVEGGNVRGVVKAIDLQKQTLTVGLPAGRGGEAAAEDRTFSLAPDAEVVLDDGRGRRFSAKEGKLDDLAAGVVVSLRLTADQKQVVLLMAEGTNVFGLVKAVDAGKKTITLTQGRGGDGGDEQTFEVSPHAVTLIDDGGGRRLSVKEATLADIPTGSAVNLRLAIDQKTVAGIRAEGPPFGGVLKAVDADKGTVTVLRPSRTDPADERTVKVAKGARIMVDGKPGTIADLKPGDDVFVTLRLTLDQKFAQAVMVGGRGR